METTELSCQELVELVTDYLEDALAPNDRLRFDAHLAECPDCGEYVEEMRVTIRLTGQLEPELLGDEARDSLLAAFRSWKHG